MSIQKGKKNKMRKTFKKLAAVALASAMTLSSSVMASAATMNVEEDNQ